MKQNVDDALREFYAECGRATPIRKLSWRPFLVMAIGPAAVLLMVLVFSSVAPSPPQASVGQWLLEHQERSTSTAQATTPPDKHSSRSSGEPNRGEPSGGKPGGGKRDDRRNACCDA